MGTWLGRIRRAGRRFVHADRETWRFRLEILGLLVTLGTLLALIRTVESSQRFFEMDQRPYVVLNGPPSFLDLPRAAGGVGVVISLKDIGRAPAIGTRVVCALMPMSTARGPTLDTFLNGWFGGLRKKLKWAPTDMVPPTDIAPNEEFTEKAYAKSRVTAALFVVGIVTYGDAFPDNHYMTEFCRIHEGKADTAWRLCPTHNVFR